MAGVDVQKSTGTLSAILPCNDLDASEAFYARLGFTRPSEEKPAPGEEDAYRILSNGEGSQLHLNRAVPGWLIYGQNPFGLYLYVEDVDRMAARFRGEILGRSRVPEHKPWGMYEFALSDPDGTLVRIGCPSRLIAKPSGGSASSAAEAP